MPRKAVDYLVFRPIGDIPSPFKIRDRGLGDEDVADRKQVGRDTKKAAKATGKAVKKTTKKVVHKGAKVTRKGAAKVEGKTETKK